MDQQCDSSNSQDTISIKLTQNNIPSFTAIKVSQQHLSLTYTVSLQNISQQLISFRHIQDSLDISVQKQITIQSFNKQNRQEYSFIKQKQKNSQGVIEKDAFKKKSILKISNIDFSSFISHLKQNNSHQVNINNKILKNNNHCFAEKNRNNYNQQILIQSKCFSKSKRNLSNSTSQIFAQNLLLKTNKFNCLKQDKVIEPINLRKQSISFKRQGENQKKSSSTQRKSNKLPLIKGSHSHPVNFTSTTLRKKAFSSYENGQSYQKNYGTLNQKMILGKSYKMNEDEVKAKKYLKKILQNRNSIIHFTNQIRSIDKIKKQFKQNYEDFY